jgi:hypothetical protein
MEYYNNIRCVYANWLFEKKPEGAKVNPNYTGPDPLMSRDAYDQLVYRNPFMRVRRSTPGCSPLLAFDRLRDDLRLNFVAKYGSLDDLLRRNAVEGLIEPDAAAAKYYSEYELPNGQALKFERQVEYATNACVLNAVRRFINDRRPRARSLGNRAKQLWPFVAQCVQQLDRDRWPHTLPANHTRLREKLSRYLAEGYGSLVHSGYGNQNTRKVNQEIERLLMSIYCMENLPFGDWVHDYYLRFIAGGLQVIDSETGECIDRANFFDDRKQSYITISRATVWNVLNGKLNAIAVDRRRNNRIDHITQSTPFNHRHSPQYSLSKVSFDDRTLSRKTSDGNWLNAYAAFDVLSGAALSCVYSENTPNVEMVWQCIRQMYRTIEDNGLMWPGEAEVENHLMKEIEQELRQLFTYVTFTTPGISRNKRAEHNIKSLKYQSEKKLHSGVGRWYGKGPYKTKSENKDEDYKQPRLPVERLIAEANQAIEHHNSMLHPNQERFPGKTRWQVLCENVHPDLGRPQKYKIFKIAGHKTATSVRNNDHVQVQYEKYAIDSYEALSRLKPGSVNVDAWYIAEADGKIKEVFLYQADTLISKATLIERYNEAKMERTGRDEQIRTEQAKRQAKFFKMEKELITEKIMRKIELLPFDEVQKIEEMLPANVADTPVINRGEVDLEEAFAKFNPDFYPEKSRIEV